MMNPARLLLAYRMRWKRRRLLYRAIRKRRQLEVVKDRTADIQPPAILCFATVRNELERLEHFLDHHRQLGVDHFLIVDNSSEDGTAEFLTIQPDVSLWRTTHSYKASRFGMDWLAWLQFRFGSGHWCLTLDADELLIYPHHETQSLAELAAQLDRQGHRSFGALMIDLYPRGPVGDTRYVSGADPLTVLNWFDADNYRETYQHKHQNLWIQGGVRARQFFASRPERAPTMGKIPFVKFSRRYVYVSSTHILLPPPLNRALHRADPTRITGALLHTKFLPSIVSRSEIERVRKEHFENSVLYDTYYADLSENPTLWHEGSTRFEGWRQLEELGLISRGDWI